jgi:prevent-host-death family protein
VETYTLTALRKQLYQVVDRVLETGVPVEIERNGKKLLIVPAQKPGSKLANLKKRKGIIGDPDELVQIKVGEWSELRNLK